MNKKDIFRFHRPLSRYSHTFGDEWFALKAEAFARFKPPRRATGKSISARLTGC
nr:MAG TPA: hypothetical protein [Caudoviricetes sp.]